MKFPTFLFFLHELGPSELGLEKWRDSRTPPLKTKALDLVLKSDVLFERTGPAAAALVDLLDVASHRENRSLKRRPFSALEWVARIT